ncbi:MAG TPA: hypothetical protein DEP35_25070 [Deltaproteobacteria bacterium]|jgi:hypothetical protein|nr:hypothetical protein [Deltaproteobacteria bacterium]
MNLIRIGDLTRLQHAKLASRVIARLRSSCEFCDAVAMYCHPFLCTDCLQDWAKRLGRWPQPNDFAQAGGLVDAQDLSIADTLCEEIENHPGVPTDSSSRQRRAALHRLLINQDLLRRSPAFDRRWYWLRNWIWADPATALDRLREFYGLVHSALYMLEDDSKTAKLTERARAALSDKRWKVNLAKAGGSVAILAESIMDLEKRQAFLNIPIATRALPGEDERALRIVLGDLVPSAKGRSKLRPGSGAPKRTETWSEEFLRFFEGGSCLTPHAAVELTLDVGRWFLGQALPRETLLSRLKAQKTS